MTLVPWNHDIVNLSQDVDIKDLQEIGNNISYHKSKVEKATKELINSKDQFQEEVGDMNFESVISVFPTDILDMIDKELVRKWIGTNFEWFLKHSLSSWLYSTQLFFRIKDKELRDYLFTKLEEVSNKFKKLWFSLFSAYKNNEWTHMESVYISIIFKKVDIQGEIIQWNTLENLRDKFNEEMREIVEDFREIDADWKWLVENIERQSNELAEKAMKSLKELPEWKYICNFGEKNWKKHVWKWKKICEMMKYFIQKNPKLSASFKKIENSNSEWKNTTDLYDIVIELV